MTVAPADTPEQSESPRAPRKSVGRYLLSGVALVLILALAWVVARTSPSEEQWQSAIPVTGTIGETLTGRNIEATVHEVRVADEVVASTGWAGPTSGIWVVADVSASAVVDDVGASLGTAELQIGTIIYSASERPDEGTIADGSLTAGLSMSGPLMFEVPRKILDLDAAHEATLRLGVDSDPRLDSVIEVPVDLATLDITASIETDEPVWGNQ